MGSFMKTGASFNTQIGGGKYWLQFKTDNRDSWELMQRVARLFLDIDGCTANDDVPVVECGGDNAPTTPVDTKIKYQYTYCVGDRVMYNGHPGEVIGMADGAVPYLVEFDAPWVGGHNGNSVPITHGRHGTNHNCWWCLEDDLQPIESNLESVQSVKTVNLYCKKGYKPGERLTQGKVYEMSERGVLTFDDGCKSRHDFREGITVDVQCTYKNKSGECKEDEC